jgi:hypothetical protein
VSPTSTATSQNAAQEAYYPISRLQLFESHDRPSWEKEYGGQAPPFDTSRPPKHWVDLSALTGVADPDHAIVEYDYFDPASHSFQKLNLTAREAATPNLRGAYFYPDFSVAPTTAVVVDSNSGTESSVNPAMLCSRAEAEEIMGEIDGDSLVEWGFHDGGPFCYDWREETRRYWAIRKGPDYHAAALLLRKKNGSGVGRPGYWSTDQNGAYVWIPNRIETDNGQRQVPVPSRLLKPNEAIFRNPFQTIVYRTDMESPYNQKNGEPGNSGAEFPPDLRATIERIDANLQQLLGMNIVTR